MFRQISHGFSNKIVNLLKNSSSAEISQGEQILGQILKISEMIQNETHYVLEHSRALTRKAEVIPC